MIDRVRVNSEASESVTYVVTFVGNTAVACTCPHFHFRSTDTDGFECKHMRRAQAVQPLSTADLVRVRTLLDRKGL